MVTFPAYFDCGEGLPVLKRIPYFPEQAQALLNNYDAIILAGAAEPVAFFGYVGGTSMLFSKNQRRIRIDTDKQDAAVALEELSQSLGTAVSKKQIKSVLAKYELPPLPTGKINSQKMCAAIAALQPEGCIVMEEGVTSGVYYYLYAPHLKPYSHLTLTGGAIGQGMPCALGAALACPDRKVINIEADGSAMYTLQALWSQAREKANVITIICSNRKYFTIEYECLRAGHSSLGKKSEALMSLNNPPLDWVNLSRSMGVPAVAVMTAEELIREFQVALKEKGPSLIEVILEK